MQIADRRVVEVLGPRPVQPDVVRRPAGPELLAARGQLPDQVGQALVVRITASLGAQDARKTDPATTFRSEALDADNMAMLQRIRLRAAEKL
jgi:hypothetical protein